MKWNRPTVGAMAMSVALSAVMAGCGGSESGEGAKEAEAGAGGGVKMVGNMYVSGMPIVKDKVTLRMVTTKSPLQAKPHEELRVVKEMEAKTNVKVQWDAFPAEGYKEKKNLIFASGDLPDAFFGNGALSDADITTYGVQGILIPLEGLIDKYAPNVKKLFELRPDYKKSVTSPDGHIYSIPTVHEQDHLTQEDALFINKKWLDKLGLAMPKTVEEFERVLKAFKEKDPNGNGKPDEIPFSFIYGKQKQDGIYSMFGAFGRLDNPDHIVVENGQVVFTADKPEYKDAVNYFHRLYAQGLLDPESFTQDTKAITAKGKNKDAPILGAFIAWNGPNLVGADRGDDYVPLAPLKGPKGEQVWNKYHGGGFVRAGFSITSASKQPEVAMRWIDELYEKRVSLEWSTGPFGVNLKELPDGSMEYIDPPKGISFGEYRHTEAPGNQSARAILQETFDKIKPNETILAKMNLWKFYQPYQPKEIYPLVVFSNEDTQKLAVMKTDLYDYVNKMQAQWIIQGKVDAEWDGYLNNLKKLKLDELMKIYKDNYTRFKSIK